MKLHHYISSIIIQASVMLLVLLLASSCGRKEADELFVRVEAVMDEHPDSALAMLDSVAYMTDGYSRSQRMRYHLLHAKAQNKAYVDFTSDSIMKEVVAYYDAHGTANEQVEAHYLLGCVYRDLKESPMALQCYLDATEKADTLSADCDYGMLMRVWGQIANEFDRQAMPYKELEALEEFRKYAKLCDDTLNYIVGIELDRKAYFLLSDTIKAIESINKASALFRKHNMDSDAAISSLPLVSIYLKRNEIREAEILLNNFERKSMLFDEFNEIAKGREHYYCIKGEYYRLVNELDSAQSYFYKALKYGQYFDAYEGLLNLYVSNNATDSIVKYSRLKDQAIYNDYTSLHTQAMFNADGMFDYSRNQRIAAEKELESAHSRILIYIILIVSCVITFVLYILYSKKIRRKEAERIMARNEYLKMLENYSKSKEELDLVNYDFANYVKIKEEEIANLQICINEIEKQDSGLGEQINVNKILQDETMQVFNDMLSPRNTHSITEKDWQSLTNLTSHYLPEFYAKIVNNNCLSKTELRVVILTRLGFSNSSISIIMERSIQHVTNTKSSANRKLFSENTSKRLYDNLLTM
ncbi:MAG: hypothetical protein MJZ36_07135 [Bacteroidaceae bacterium]|nr:hypothetical protein [Bacteroidaceae bacterium]